MKRFIEYLIFPIVVLFSPVFYFVARNGAWKNVCRRWGFEPLQVHFYQPIPEYELIPASYFETPQILPGFELNPAHIHQTLAQLGAYASECVWPDNAASEGQYHALNPSFGYSSGALSHTMIRAHSSRRAIEIGSGYSSLVTLEALKKNNPAGDYEFTLIEPYPRQWVKTLADDERQVNLIIKKAEDIPIETYLSLEAGDLFFIDSSHVSKLNSDVNFLYLNILPRLKPGVIIHIHDIYIPYEYPHGHFHGRHKIYWNEQYILQAFLTGNDYFEVIMPGYYVQKDLSIQFQQAFPAYDADKHRLTSSFWLRKVR